MLHRDLQRLTSADRTQLRQLAGELHNSDRNWSPRATRHLLPVGTILGIEVDAPGSGTIAAEVLGRDISSSGVSFLVGVFLYPGSVCTVDLTTLRSERVKVQGVIARCSHVKGRVHDCGVQFKSPIDPAVYTDQPALGEARASEAPEAGQINADSRTPRARQGDRR